MRRAPVLLLVLLLAGCRALCPPDQALPDAVGVASASAAPVGSLEAGAAVVDVTPPLGTGLAGFGLTRDAESVHDPITARALALRRGSLTAVIVVVDVVGLHHTALERLRARLAGRVPPEAVLLSATHTHSGPDTLGMWGLPPIISGIDDDVLATVEEGIARAATTALERLAPVTLRVARAQAPEEGISRNKRQPDLVDRTITTLAFDRTDDGRPQATLVHFACHPEGLGSRNEALSADFPWALRDEVEDARRAPCVYVNGALGGMVTTDQREHTFAEIERIGRAIGRLSIASVASATPVEADLAAASVPLRLPVENGRYQLAEDFGIFGDRAFEDGGHVATEVAALRLGPVSFVTAPGEPLPRVGFDLAALASTPVALVVGLGQDELGYLIDPRDWEDERYDYERTVSPGRLSVPLVQAAAERALAATLAPGLTHVHDGAPGAGLR